MSTSLSTPGVYIRIQEPALVQPLSLSVTGFVGQATSGPLNYAQALTNWGQFQDIFGSFTGFAYLPYAVYGFFQNGGIRCHVVRVAHACAASATAVLNAQTTAAAVNVCAANPGCWGNHVTVAAGPSSGTMVLARLTKAAVSTDQTITLTTVAGIQAGDSLTLTDPGNPLNRGTFPVASVNSDPTKLTVTFTNPIGQPYPSGTSVVGLGFQLTARYSPNGLLARQEVFDNLAVDPANARYFMRIVNGIPEDPDYVNKAQNGQSILIRLSDPGTGLRPAPTPAGQPASLTGGIDWPNHTATGLDARYYTGNDAGKAFTPSCSSGVPAGQPAQYDKYGLAVLEAIPDIGLVAIPDLSLPDLYASVTSAAIPISQQGIVFTPVPASGAVSTNLKQGQSDMLAHCALMQDRFAILDSPRGAQIRIGTSPIDDYVANFRLSPASKNAALYYPWIRERAADFNGYDLLIPPSGHLAGIYAGVEALRGIGKSPANQLIQGLVDFEFCLSDDDQAVLNPLSVNCLRALPGRGLMVWGARTLSLDAKWRYANLRRIYHAIVMNILINLRWTVFEPNTPKLWSQVRAVLTVFFKGLFSQGALAGKTAADAFFVQCDATTNPAESIAQGRMLARIGFAPAYPAEFVVVNIKRTAEALAVTEQT